MRFPPVEDIPDIETKSVNINKLDKEMHRLIEDVRFAVTHHDALSRRSRELVSSLDDLLVQHQYTHKSMRLLLRHAYRNADYPIVPDAASLAREQVEKIYQAVIILQGPHKWIRQYLRNAWQKDYEAYLLELDEYGRMDRYHEHLYQRYPTFLENTRRAKLKATDSILVSNFAKKVIEYQWYHRKGTKPVARPTWFTRRGSVGHFLGSYFYFPTPWDVMTKVRNNKLLLFLDRWDREYKMLSEYSHVLIGKVTPQRAGRSKSVESLERAKLYGRKKAESFIFLSSLAGASLCTVMMPYLGSGYGSKNTTREYWNTLSSFSLIAKGLWALYAEKTLR
jgi:hypothetical protein